MPRQAPPNRTLRWHITALAALMLAVLPALPQSGRAGRSGGAGAAQSPVETLTGSLRSISATSLVIAADDDRVIPVEIPAGVKYLSTMDKVKASDFEPGDHVTVEATRDDGGHYRAASMTMNKKGSAEDKQRAKAAAQEASAAPSPAANPSASGANAAPGRSNSGGDSSSPDRPRLQRANSGGNSNAGSGSGSASNGSSNDDSVPSSTASGGGNRRPAVSPPPDSSRSTGDDSGPPVLRRSPPAALDSGAAQTASGRPSLSAEDVNGVTRTPAILPPPNIGSDGQQRESLDDDDVISQTRQEAWSFTRSLPDYIVKQVTTRYRSDSASKGRTSWQALDVVTADLVYLNGKENYTNVMDNGRPTRDASLTGSWSEGEFASSLQAILSPYSSPDFRNKRQVTIVNRPAYKYDYVIDQPHSAWRIQTEGQTFQPSYGGSIWIDKETFRVLRLEMASRDVPRSFPIDTAESSVDYDFVLIGDQKYLLPVHSESLSCWRGTSQCSRNVIEFRNYRKYTADSSISFGEAVPEK